MNQPHLTKKKALSTFQNRVTFYQHHVHRSHISLCLLESRIEPEILNAAAGFCSIGLTSLITLLNCNMIMTEKKNCLDEYNHHKILHNFIGL